MTYKMNFCFSLISLYETIYNTSIRLPKLWIFFYALILNENGIRQVGNHCLINVFAKFLIFIITKIPTLGYCVSLMTQQLSSLCALIKHYFCFYLITLKLIKQHFYTDYISMDKHFKVCKILKSFLWGKLNHH